ncbi:MAG: hypothetical protein A2Y94_06025 [Caldithrix sp. RBG_13_44_9]|nr:MAG: hypothetical protein A2Y94_06025 [Caldithrix sp. RBG_13_44_9]
MDAESQGIAVEEVEIFTWKNPGGNPAESELMMKNVLESIRQARWQITVSPNDQDYQWLVRKSDYLLGYFTATKRETGIYLGRTHGVPLFVSTNITQPGTINTNSQGAQPLTESIPYSVSSNGIVGNWGDLKASQINYYDPSGMQIGSGLSKGYGFEFKSDQSYAQSFLATSSFPNYKIFVYTTGTYMIDGDQMILTPQDRHYRKWESNALTTDEHSRPEREQYTWKKRNNDITGKSCLYLIRSGESEEKEYCQE